MGANQSGATLGTSEPIEVLDISDDEETVPQTRARCRRRIYDEKPIDLTVDSDEEVERPAPTMSLRSGKTMGKRPALLDEDMQRSLRKAVRSFSGTLILCLILSTEKASQRRTIVHRPIGRRRRRRPSFIARTRPSSVPESTKPFH